MRVQREIVILALVATCTATIHANPPETVVVGDPGNDADSTGYGAVNYEYRIGKFEVTNAEYCEFLNAVAKEDVRDLYSRRMAGEFGGILRKGSLGSHRYETKPGWERKPVSYVTWESCARYANWLSSGGGEDGDTEEGAYGFRGRWATPTDHARLAAGRTTMWAIAGEDEWYKAAYYDPNKTGGGGYWPYAGKNTSPPPSNMNSGVIAEVGSIPSAASAYGTFDQNGNLWEYNETKTGNKVGLRGGSYFIDDHKAYLHASTRYEVLSAKWPNYGFRVVALGSGKASTTKAKTSGTRPNSKPRAPRTGPKTFYVSQSMGNDSFTGEASVVKGTSGPWKTLARASVQYIPGDTILLKRGDTWNEELAPKGSGNPKKPITIGAYGEGDRPIIDREDDKKDRTGIRLSDQEGYKIIGIEFNRCMTGIYADYSDGCPTKQFILIEDCYFHDSLLYQHYEDYPRRKIGLGVCFFSYERENRVVLKDIMIRNCVFRRLASGVWTNSPDNFNQNASFIYNFANMNMEDCLFEEGYQWPMGIRGVDGGAVRRCVTHDIGEGFRSFNGVAGAMFFRCKDWVFEDSEWGFVSIGLGSGDGEAFDFEGNCDNMTMRNCLFHDTDGPGFLLCCYASDGNPNRKIVMENCVLNGKSKRPIGLPRCAIVNTTDWNESTWRNCRFYLSKGEALMRVMDPEKEKRSSFVNCRVKNLSDACKSPNLAKGKPTSSSSQTGSEPVAAFDGNVATAWEAKSFSDQWLQIDFGQPRTVNEFRIAEAPGSSINRYAIQYWDAEKRKWVGCFNGMGIGREFVAPIVSRRTRAVRLHIVKTLSGPPAIAELEVYNAPTGRIFNDATGEAATKLVGK